MDEIQQLYKVLGRNIKYYRELHNIDKPRSERISQEKLAEFIEMSPSLISNMESEKISQGISVATLWKISKVLNVSIEKFFEQR